MTNSGAVLQDEEDHEQWRIALYYCYVAIENVQDHIELQRKTCQKQGFQGRIRVSHEGINGVLSGHYAALKNYESQLREELISLQNWRHTEHNKASHHHEQFELDVKYCKLRPELPVGPQLFDSLMVKETTQVVSLFEPEDTTTVQGSKKKNGFSKQSNRRRRRREQRQDQKLKQQLAEAPQSGEDQLSMLRELSEIVPSFPQARHLSPEEWNEKLMAAAGGSGSGGVEEATAGDSILLDCRNVYESRVGYFQALDPTLTPTLLTNTRKYSDLPKILAQSKEQFVGKKQIFMYCTGGVRCEQASRLVQAMVAQETSGCEVYQLHGGIQRYLEHFGGPPPQQPSLSNGDDVDSPAHSKPPSGPCLFRGKNFVFDPRRVDPMQSMTDSVVGKCMLCEKLHDDYDNGHAPCENREARCCKCRILLLVCPSCRQTVQSWGEPDKPELPTLYCGTGTCSDYQITGSNPTRKIQSTLLCKTIL